MKYGSIIPLVGGMTLGNIKATGVKPKFLLSYEAFKSNDSHIVNYLQDCPYHIIDDKTDNEAINKIRSEYRESLDFVSAVPPCAGLSGLNNSKGDKGRGSEAAQNDWMYLSANYVLENLRPKVFWGENAPGLYSTVGTGVRNKMIDIAERWGYTLSFVKTDTHLHGIPQHRRRTFYFFWRDGNPPIMEWKYRQPNDLELIEYLNQIPEDSVYQKRFFTRDQPVTDWKLYEFALEKTGLSDIEFRKSYLGALYHYISKNNLLDEAIEWLDTKYPNYEGEERKKLDHIKNKISQGKGFWDSSPFFVDKFVNAIIGKNMHCIVHPTEDRFLNIRECMWLMGLPHDFKMNIEEGRENWNQITQNVPVNTAAYFTDQIKKYVTEQLPSSDYALIMQDNISKKITLTQETLKKPKLKTNPII